MGTNKFPGMSLASGGYSKSNITTNQDSRYSSRNRESEMESDTDTAALLHPVTTQTIRG